MADTINSQSTGVRVQMGPPPSDIAIDPQKPTLKDILSEFGGTGTIIVGGILSSVDYNNDLTGTQRIDVFDEMRKGDATVRAALLAVKLPILSARWYVKSASQNPKDKDVATFIENQLFNSMDITWTDWLRHCLNFLDYGSMAFEKIYQTIEDGEYKGKIGWKKFAPRLSKTIYRWRMPDNVTTGITQILPTGGMRGVPSWKLMLFVNEQEGENYEGVSILRAAFKHWYIKEGYYKIDSVAAERQGLGIPYVKIPPGASDEDRRKVNELMRNLRANEQSNIEVPVGWDIGFLDMKTNQTKNLKDMILHHDRQITKSVLAQFLELGGSQTGSFALSANQSELFLLSLQAVAKKIQEVLNNHAVRELVDLNFGKQKDYPSLEFGRIGTVDFEKLATALAKLATGGLITAGPEIEEYIRNVMDLPAAAQTSENDQNEEDADSDADTLPVPKVQKQINPVKVVSSEGKLFEDQLFGKFKRTQRTFNEDARQLRQQIQAIIAAKTS